MAGDPEEQTKKIVVLRESGGPNIPEAFEIDRESAAYWVARSSRAMTPVDVAASLDGGGPRRTNNKDCRPPRKRGTQYPRGVRDRSRSCGVLGRPVKRGDDTGECSSFVS